MTIQLHKYLKEENYNEIAYAIQEKVKEITLIANEENEIFNFQAWGFNNQDVSELANLLNDLESNEYVTWGNDQAILTYKKEKQEFYVSAIDTELKEFDDKNGVRKFCVIADCTVSSTYGEENENYISKTEYYWDNNDEIDNNLLVEAQNFLEKEFPNSTFKFETEYKRKNWDSYRVELYLTVTEQATKYVDTDAEDEATVEVRDYFSWDSELELTILKGKPTNEFIAYVLAVRGYDQEDWAFKIEGDSINYFWRDEE